MPRSTRTTLAAALAGLALAAGAVAAPAQAAPGRDSAAEILDQTLSGVVFEPNGEPLADAVVVALVSGDGWTPVAEVPTASDGSWTISSLAPSTSVILAVLPGRRAYAASYIGGAVVADSAALFTTGTTGIEWTVPKSGRFHGTVRMRSGAGVAHAHVLVQYPQSPGFGAQFVVANRKGAWSTSGMGRAPALVSFTGPTSKWTLEFYRGAVFEQDATLVKVAPGASKTLGATIEKAAQISGTVPGAAGGELVKVLVHSAADGDWYEFTSTEVAEDGSFRLTGVQPGKMKLVVWADDSPRVYWRNASWFGLSKTITLAPGQTLSLTQTLPSYEGALAAGGVAIPSDIAVGDVLTPVFSGWDAGVDFEYLWSVDGSVRNDLSTSPTFTVKSSMIGKEITLQVVGHKLGYDADGAIASGGGTVAP